MASVSGPSSWLFVKGGESIRIVRPHGFSLIVQGPGLARQRQDFADEDKLQAYQIAMAERLAEHGFMLYGVDRDRRNGVERRNARRDSPDRRSSQTS